jgi:condensin complex subunit 2
MSTFVNSEVHIIYYHCYYYLADRCLIALAPGVDTLNEKAIAPSLQNFSFEGNEPAPEVSLYRDNSHAVSDDDDDDGDDGGVSGFSAAAQDDFAMDVDGGAPPAEEDFFGGDSGAHNDFAGTPSGFGGDDGDAGSDIVQANHAGPGHAIRPGRLEPFDPRRAPNERDIVINGNANGGMMEYFDQTFKKNWAGPEHWKLRRVVRRRKFTFFFLQAVYMFLTTAFF